MGLPNNGLVPSCEYETRIACAIAVKETVTMEGGQLKCSKCSAPAVFMTPVGRLCGEHALLATVYQAPSAEKWSPIVMRSRTR